jgi:hypothetical protein
MKQAEVFRVPFLAVAVILSVVFFGLDSSAHAERLGRLLPDGSVEILDGEALSLKAQIPVTKILDTGSIVFDITYADDGTNLGFDDPAEGADRKARLEDVFTYIADVLNVTGGLDVTVEQSQNSGTLNDFLAFAGTFYFDTAGFSNGTAFDRLMTSDNPGGPEIHITVDFGHDWYTGTELPGSGESDLFSVLLHEVTHGLGITTLIDSDGSGTLFPSVYTVWDSLIIRGSDSASILGGTPPLLQTSAGDLVGEDLFLDGASAFTAYGQGVAPGVYAPDGFASGSSLGHWDTDNIVGGAVMEHQITTGTARRSYSAVEIGALVDLGYSNAAAPTGSPSILVAPSGSVDFGDVEVGNTGTQMFTVTNFGSGQLDGVLTSDSSEFSVVGAASYSVGANANTQLQVQFAPLAEGDFTGTLTFSGGDNGPVTVNVLGTGEVIVVPVPVLGVSPAGSRSFGEVDVNDFRELTWTVENTGDGTLTGTLSSSSADFNVIGNGGYSLTAGGTRQFTVRFSPLRDDSFSGTLTFTNADDASQNITLALSATGVALPATGCAASTGSGVSPGWGGDLLLVAGLGLMLSMGLIRREQAWGAIDLRR